mmetsp:Transcript_23467/g.49114  ORF Transcript_23467/g.49114 Transcript_23467/m.49114 type:complete len:382 (+) Transcript_23467:876-2021(+)
MHGNVGLPLPPLQRRLAPSECRLDILPTIKRCAGNASQFQQRVECRCHPQLANVRLHRLAPEQYREEYDGIDHHAGTVLPSVGLLRIHAHAGRVVSLAFRGVRQSLVRGGEFAELFLRVGIVGILVWVDRAGSFAIGRSYVGGSGIRFDSEEIVVFTVLDPSPATIAVVVVAIIITTGWMIIVLRLILSLLLLPQSSLDIIRILIQSILLPRSPRLIVNLTPDKPIHNRHGRFHQPAQHLIPPNRKSNERHGHSEYHARDESRHDPPGTEFESADGRCDRGGESVEGAAYCVGEGRAHALDDVAWFLGDEESGDGEGAGGWCILSIVVVVVIIVVFILNVFISLFFPISSLLLGFVSFSSSLFCCCGRRFCYHHRGATATT